MTTPIELIYDQHVADEKLKAGTKYERLAALVFKRLDQDGTVLHDLRLRGDGKSATHQIDVTIDRDGFDRRLILECRDKEPGNKLGLGDVRDFYGAVSQLGAEGAMITTEGYTKGAIEFATDEGITLAVLRGFRDDQDWEGRLQRVLITASAYIADETSIRAELLAIGDVNFSYAAVADPNLIPMLDEYGTDVGTLADVVRTALGQVPVGTVGTAVECLTFDAPLTIQLAAGNEVAIRGVKVTAEFEEIVEKSVVDAGDRVATLILQTLDGVVDRVIFDTDLKMFSFDQDGMVLPR